MVTLLSRSFFCWRISQAQYNQKHSADCSLFIYILFVIGRIVCHITSKMTWVERGTVRVECLAHEHNAMSPARS